MAESPGFTGLGALSLPGFPVSPLPGQCINSQPWLRALTYLVAPLMRGRPGCGRCRARATGLSPVRAPWAGAEAAQPWGWCVALCATTALAGVVPLSCVCGARGRFGGVGAGAGCCVFPVSPCPPPVSCAVCGGPSHLGVPYPRSLVRHCMRSVRSAGSVRLPFWFSPRVLCVCVRSRSRGVRAPPPPRVGVVRAPHTVPVLGAGRAVPLDPCPSACPAPVPCSVRLAWGGVRPGPVSPYLAWGCALPVGWVRAWGPVTNPTPHALASWLCALAWRAVGAAQVRLGGAPLAWVRGDRDRVFSHLPPLVLSGVRPGPTTHWLWVRWCGRGDPSPTQ